MNPKIYFNGRRINGRFDTFKASCKRAGKAIVRWSLITAAAYAIFLIGALTYSTSTVTASTSVVEAPAPIMDRIADCESGNGTLGSANQKGKNGQLAINVNTNGTVDVGKYQINSIHFKEAASLGYDLMTEEGNTAYAKWLYANKGTGDWASSARCWVR
jgi:hypothetical protein